MSHITRLLPYRVAVLLLMILLLSGGCASYRYEVVLEDGQALAVQKDQDLVLPGSPAEIRLRQVESRCVVLVTNPGSQPFEIDSGGSSLVDPTGQSRAIAGQLVPPGAYVKYILPPMRDSAPRGPQFQIGFGMFVEATSSIDEPGPWRRAVYLSPGAGNMEFWEWPGSGETRLLLSLEPAHGDRQTREIRLRRLKN